MVRIGRPGRGPSRLVLGWLLLGVVLVHALLLFGLTAPLEVQLSATSQTKPVQVRVLPQTPPAAPVRPIPRPLVRAPMAPPAPAQPVPIAEVTPLASASEPQPEEPARMQTTETPVLAPAAAAPVQETAPAPMAGAVSGPATGWPLVSLGALPSSRLITYQLTGMDKGLTYHASGELRWQHNDTAYELSLSVRAFLVGRRQWRSVGQIDATGLAPRRFSDNWRSERAAHFDREQQRVVFSGNSTPAPLQPGAQDQVSLYVQLAAAMAGEPERFVPGTRLQVQTATVRDAMPWSLVMEGAESLPVDGQNQWVSRWVCQPRNQYDARVEFWVSAQQAWMPVRIRITQASGSYIDLLWRGTEPLPPLPVGTETTDGAKGS